MPSSNSSKARERLSIMDAITSIIASTSFVTCGDFEVTTEPVSRALWKAVMGDGNGDYTAPDLHQVGEIHWFDAVRFCNRLSEMEGLAPSYENFEWVAHTGYSIPSEAEWRSMINIKHVDNVSMYDGFLSFCWERGEVIYPKYCSFFIIAPKKPQALLHIPF